MTTLNFFIGTLLTDSIEKKYGWPIAFWFFGFVEMTVLGIENGE
jgi:hypothetical protein